MSLRMVVLSLMVIFVACCGCHSRPSAGSRYDPAELDRLARHLSEQGWVLYGKRGCALCQAQREVFGAASARIHYVECDPFAENSESERCVRRGINQLPVWVREVDGKEIQRLESYRTPTSLAAAAGIEFDARKPRND